MMKKISVVLLLATLAACGPSPTPPADQSAQPAATPGAPPPPAPAPQAAPPPPPAPAPAAPRPRPPQAAAAPTYTPPPKPVCADCGTIVAVNERTVQGEPSAIGTLGGAAAGAAAGGQFGKKSGKFAAMALGAIGGAFAGREVEKHVTAKTVYDVSVNMDGGGGTRTVTVESLNGLGVGAHVRVVGNTLQFAGS